MLCRRWLDLASRVVRRRRLRAVTAGVLAQVPAPVRVLATSLAQVRVRVLATSLAQALDLAETAAAPALVRAVIPAAPAVAAERAAAAADLNSPHHSPGLEGLPSRGSLPGLRGP